jgi:hypothetical protein|tara:strand:+ start:2044 stop:2187 length:144 start_codon:yes stop_codon:yes gene_type:complete
MGPAAKSKRSYEYLFYGEVPLLSQKTKAEDEILRIAEARKLHFNSKE